MPSNTTSIGLKNLIPAIHLMENYKVYSSKQVIDEEKSRCHSCPFFVTCQNHNSLKCNSCTKKVYKIIDTPTYINEKNRFGLKHVLKRNALLLFIYLHFLHPDQYGLVTINIKEAALILKCEERTIRNNFNLLNRHNYICLQKGLYPGTYRAFIQSYAEYFITANQGGRGYITLSYQTFEALANESNLNSIRLSLRVLVSSVDSGIPGLLHKEHTYKEFCQFLPSYCCNKIIKNAISSASFKKLFQVKSMAHTLYLDLKEDYHPGIIANRIRKECAIKVDDWITSLNKSADDLGYRIGKHWFPNDTEKNDIANISLQYDVEIILVSLKQIYQDFILTNRTIKNLGALVRTFANSNRYFLSEEK